MGLPKADAFVDADVDILVQRAKTPAPTPGNVQAPIAGTYSAPYVSTIKKANPDETTMGGTTVTTSAVSTVSPIALVALAALAVWFFWTK